MAAPTFNFKITTPFAKNGIRQDIPETSGSTEMSYDQGYTAAYQQPPAEGGRFIEMPKFNEALYRAFSAIQEIQNILSGGGFTVSEAITAQTAQAAQTLAGIIGLDKGGTGATNSAQARVNLGLGNVNNTSDADKPISNATQAALNGKQPAGDYATSAALAGKKDNFSVLPIEQGGTGRTGNAVRFPRYEVGPFSGMKNEIMPYMDVLNESGAVRLVTPWNSIDNNRDDYSLFELNPITKTFFIWNIPGGMGVNGRAESGTMLRVHGSAKMDSATLLSPLAVSSGGTGATDADRARANLGAAPVPAAGTWWSTYNLAMNEPVRLPLGGTWVVFVISAYSNGSINGVGTQILAGGSVITANSARLLVLAWRIS